MEYHTCQESFCCLTCGSRNADSCCPPKYLLFLQYFRREEESDLLPSVPWHKLICIFFLFWMRCKKQYNGCYLPLFFCIRTFSTVLLLSLLCFPGHRYPLTIHFALLSQCYCIRDTELFPVRYHRFLFLRSTDVFLRKICQFFLSNCDLQCFSFSRLQSFVFAYPTETTIFFLYLCLRKRCINLHNFFSCISISDISNFHFNCKFFLEVSIPLNSILNSVWDSQNPNPEPVAFCQSCQNNGIRQKSLLCTLRYPDFHSDNCNPLQKGSLHIFSPRLSSVSHLVHVSQQDVCNRISTLLPRLEILRAFMFSMFQNVSQFDRTTRLQKQDDRNLFSFRKKDLLLLFHSDNSLLLSCGGLYPLPEIRLSTYTAAFASAISFASTARPSGRIKGLLAYASNGLSTCFASSGVFSFQTFRAFL